MARRLTDSEIKLLARTLCSGGGDPQAMARSLGAAWDAARDTRRLLDLGEVFRCAECRRWEDASVGDGAGLCERCEPLVNGGQG